MWLQVRRGVAAGEEGCGCRGEQGRGYLSSCTAAFIECVSA